MELDEERKTERNGLWLINDIIVYILLKRSRLKFVGKQESGIEFHKAAVQGIKL